MWSFEEIRARDLTNRYDDLGLFLLLLAEMSNLPNGIVNLVDVGSKTHSLYLFGGKIGPALQSHWHQTWENKRKHTSWYFMFHVVAIGWAGRTLFICIVSSLISSTSEEESVRSASVSLFSLNNLTWLVFVCWSVHHVVNRIICRELPTPHIYECVARSSSLSLGYRHQTEIRKSIILSSCLGCVFLGSRTIWSKTTTIPVAINPRGTSQPLRCFILFVGTNRE